MAAFASSRVQVPGISAPEELNPKLTTGCTATAAHWKKSKGQRTLKTSTQIKAKIAEWKADDRYKAPPAAIQINAPLALIQTSIAARISALKWALENEHDEEQAKH